MAYPHSTPRAFGEAAGESSQPGNITRVHCSGHTCTAVNPRARVALAAQLVTIGEADAMKAAAGAATAAKVRALSMIRVFVCVFVSF